MIREKDLKYTLRCMRCLWEWFPRSLKLPDVCPKCKSPYWNKPRQKKPTVARIQKREGAR